VAVPPAQHQRWLIQPLIDAGLPLDEIGTLVVRLAFAGIVAEGGGVLAAVRDLVADHPPAVRAAWHQTIGRMLVAEPGTANGPGGWCS
jgi:hypothetical protein